MPEGGEKLDFKSNENKKWSNCEILWRRPKDFGEKLTSCSRNSVMQISEKETLIEFNHTGQSLNKMNTDKNDGILIVILHVIECLQK